MRARLFDDDKVLRQPIPALLAIAVGWVVWSADSLGALAIFVGVTASIAVHEGAHLAAARACGVRISQFFVGFGPRLWRREVRGTELSLRLLPFVGGAVEIHPEDEPGVRHRSWLVIAVAGPLANLLLGWVLLSGAAWLDHSPPAEALSLGTDQTTQMVTLTAGTITDLPDLVAGSIGAAAGGETPDDSERLLSPVSMAQIGNGASDAGGAVLLLRIIAVVNIALGLMNLLPIPPLDGSLIAIHAFEGVATRVSRREVKVPTLLFRSVAYGFTGVLLLAMAAAMVVDLHTPIAAFG